MKLKNLILAVLVIGLVLAFLVQALFASVAKAKAELASLREKSEYYRAQTALAEEWLLSTQLPGGALANRPPQEGLNTIVPYFASIAACSLLESPENPQHRTAVKKYLDWHFSRLNEREDDIHGLAYTIDNYSVFIASGTVVSETSEKTYDSIDSYAALFLILLEKYHLTANDDAYLLRHRDEVMGVIDLLARTVDNEGLAAATPGNPTHYLMDNIEVSRALKSAETLLTDVYLPATPEKSASQLLRRLDSISALSVLQRGAIESDLWNESEERFEVGIFADHTPIPFEGWQRLYPDALAQVFPIAFQYLSPDSEAAAKLYGRFCDSQSWETLSPYLSGRTDSVWGVAAYIGAVMDDEDRVKTYFEAVRTHPSAGFSNSGINADAAWVVLAGHTMIDRYEDRIAHLTRFGIIR